MAGITFAVSPVVSSPREYGYRSKITPHFNAPRRFALKCGGSEFQVAGSETEATTAELQEASIPGAVSLTRNPELETRNPDARSAFPIGFLRQGTRFDLVDVPRCPIATDAINARLLDVRAEVLAKRDTFTRGATLLLREASGVVTTDYDAIVTETVGELKLSFLARDFFQNNPFILPAFTGYVRAQAAAAGARFLVDAYCGSGLFALSAASAFEKVVGVEISETSVQFARANATANNIHNATFQAGNAAAIFEGLPFASAESVVVIDPPRKGCDRDFLQQLFAYAPRAVVYVSCDPATQMRDLREFLAAGYQLTAAQPFDLFPQTRHLECVLTLRKM
jgi:23S rRNA (uracil1939-C5)-methyltransferase/tRNA (uracil-5-)-methyltransferase